jgi:hypothetical protein
METIVDIELKPAPGTQRRPSTPGTNRRTHRLLWNELMRASGGDERQARAALEQLRSVFGF